MNTSLVMPVMDQPQPTDRPEGESRFLIRNVGWQGYLKLVELFEENGPRIAYLDGTVELMSPHMSHEQFKSVLGMMVEALTEELDIPRRALGSTTFFSQNVDRGAEPDECYYLSNIDRLVSQDRGDLDRLPPPDLVIEVEITSALLDKLTIYAGLGVPEIWRYDGQTLNVLLLQPNGSYAGSTRSLAFPLLPMDAFAQQLQAYDPARETRWIKAFRVWVREVVASLFPI